MNTSSIDFGPEARKERIALDRASMRATRKWRKKSKAEQAAYLSKLQKAIKGKGTSNAT